LENQKSQCRRKTTQLVSRNETTQLNRRKTTQLGNMNETTQQEKTTQLASRNETTQLVSRNETTQLGNTNETTQLVSRNETTQLCTAVDHLQPPATACTACNRLRPPTTACNRLQPPATACNRLHRLHRLYSRIGFFYLLKSNVSWLPRPSGWRAPQFEKHCSKQFKRNKNENIGYKLLRESGSGGPKRKIEKCSEHRVHKRALPSNYTNSFLPKCRKRDRTDETVMSSISSYNLRPRNGRRVEPWQAIEMKTQQGGPVRARKSRERHYSHYIEQQVRSSSKNTRRSSQPQNCQERKGEAYSNRSISLEVLAGDVNYKS
ncbi:uncharacterized protein TNCV_3170031, partial [Trichonephila clavipes]